MTTMMFDFHSDPSHGWLQTDRETLEKYGLTDKISVCSFVRGQQVFLEEDCDASLFVETLQNQGIEVKCVEIFHEFEAPCRAYRSYYNVI